VGVLVHGAVLDADNPAAGVFRSAAGEVGFRIFGVILWSAAISSVVGAAYTSVSFFKTFHPVFARHERACISVFIVLSTSVFVLVGKPAQLLVFAGAVNGLILPIALAIVLVAATNRRTASGLMWEALASSTPGAQVSVHHVTAANGWALDVGLAARMAIYTNGYLCLRRMKPPAPYLHHGSLL